MCFKKVFLSSCGCGRRIAVKWTTRTACGHGGQFLLRRAMSRLSSKYLSLLFEIFLNNAEQNLNSGQLHHLPTSNGAEITSLLFAVIHLSQGILNPFRGIYIQPFRGIYSALSRDYSALSRDFSALSRDYSALSRDYSALWREYVSLSKNDMCKCDMLSAHNAVCSTAIT